MAVEQLLSFSSNDQTENNPHDIEKTLLEVLEVNGRLDGEPALVNSSPYGDGWMVKMKLADEGEKAGLLSSEAYKDKVG